MEVKKVMPVVKPVNTVSQVKPVQATPVAPVVKPVIPQPVQPQRQVVPVESVLPPKKEETKGSLFSPAPASVTEVPKKEKIADVKAAVKNVKAKAVEEDEDIEDENEEQESSSNKKGKKKSESKKKFEGPRSVKVYGMELFVENNPDVELEAIRQRIVSEFHYPEFSKERTFMSFDENTGIIVPVIQFEKRG